MKGIPAGYEVVPEPATQAGIPEGYEMVSAPTQPAQQISAPETKPQDSFMGERATAILEPAATLISGAAAEPIAGLAGAAQLMNPFADAEKAAETVRTTRELLTYKPMTEAGQEGLQAVGKFLEPVGKALTATEKAIGDKV